MKEKIEKKDWMQASYPLDAESVYLMFVAKKPASNDYPGMPPGEYYRGPKSWPWLFDASDPDVVSPVLAIGQGFVPFSRRQALDEIVFEIQHPEFSYTSTPVLTIIPREPYPIEITQLTSSPAPALESPLSTPYPVPEGAPPATTYP